MLPEQQRAALQKTMVQCGFIRFMIKKAGGGFSWHGTCLSYLCQMAQSEKLVKIIVEVRSYCQ